MVIISCIFTVNRINQLRLAWYNFKYGSGISAFFKQSIFWFFVSFVDFFNHFIKLYGIEKVSSLKVISKTLINRFLLFHLVGEGSMGFVKVKLFREVIFKVIKKRRIRIKQLPLSISQTKTFWGWWLIASIDTFKKSSFKVKGQRSTYQKDRDEWLDFWIHQILYFRKVFWVIYYQVPHCILIWLQLNQQVLQKHQCMKQLIGHSNQAGFPLASAKSLVDDDRPHPYNFWNLLAANVFLWNLISILNLMQTRYYRRYKNKIFRE